VQIQEVKELSQRFEPPTEVKTSKSFTRKINTRFTASGDFSCRRRSAGSALALFSLPVDAFGSYRPPFIRRLFEEEKGV
jgi:hypothetical protein